jgi:hypothetical protein
MAGVVGIMAKWGRGFKFRGDLGKLRAVTHNVGKIHSSSPTGLTARHFVGGPISPRAGVSGFKRCLGKLFQMQMQMQCRRGGKNHIDPRVSFRPSCNLPTHLLFPLTVQGGKDTEIFGNAGVL